MTHITLIGFMGCGKSTVGHLLAHELGWQYVDVDNQIELSVGKKIPQIFAEDGEVIFRRHEIFAHRDLAAFAEKGNYVYGSGGGSIMNTINMLEMKRTGKVVYLDVPLDVCSERVLADKVNVRPLAADPAKFNALHQLRAPLYRHFADFIADGANSAENVRKILTWYKALPPEQ